MLKSEIIEQFNTFCVLKGLAPDDARIRATINHLLEQGNTGEQISKALAGMVNKTKWFPDISELHAEIHGSDKDKNRANDDAANALADKIMSLAANSSKTDFTPARQELGDGIFDLVSQFCGSFRALSDIQGNEVTNYRSQLRGFMRSRIKDGKIVDYKYNGEKVVLIENNNAGELKAVDFNKFLPDNS